MKIRILIVVLLLLSSLEARKSEFTLQLGEDGDIEPSFYYDKTWLENSTSSLSFGIGYYSWGSFEEKPLQYEFKDVPNSKNAIVIEQKSLMLDAIKYSRKLSIFDVKVGLGGEYLNIAKKEYGYYMSKRDDGNYVSFDNDVDINLFRPYITMEALVTPIKNFEIIAFTTISPYSWLNVSQNTGIKPLMKYDGNSKSSETQDVGYNVEFEMNYKFTSYLKIALNMSYDKLPMNYSMAVINSKDKFNPYFEPLEVDIEETTTKNTLKLSIKETKLKSLGIGLGSWVGSWFGFEVEPYEDDGKDVGSLVFGVGQITKSYKDKNPKRDASSSANPDYVNNIVTIGYEKKF